MLSGECDMFSFDVHAKKCVVCSYLHAIMGRARRVFDVRMTQRIRQCTRIVVSILTQRAPTSLPLRKVVSRHNVPTHVIELIQPIAHYPAYPLHRWTAGMSHVSVEVAIWTQIEEQQNIAGIWPHGHVQLHKRCGPTLIGRP